MTNAQSQPKMVPVPTCKHDVMQDCPACAEEMIVALRAKVDELTAALRIAREAVWSGGDMLKAIAVIDAALAVNSQDR